MTALAQTPDNDVNDRAIVTESLWRETLRRVLRQRSAVVGLILIIILASLAIFAPWIAPYPPNQVLIGIEDVKKRQAPCVHLLGCPADQPQHLLGIDGNVRDLFSRVIYGTRISFRIGFVTVSFAVVVGTLLGAVAGYAGGWLDDLIMRALDVVLAFPALLLAIAIVTVLGPGLTNAMLAIAFVTIPQYARVVRGSVIVIRELEFVEASRALGATSAQILLRRILPNTLSPLIVQATLGIGTAVLETAALSFIGLGAQPPTPEWGYMIAEEFNQLFSAPHLIFFPGVAITLTVLAFNLLGDGLRDALDPRLVQIVNQA